MPTNQHPLLGYREWRSLLAAGAELLADGSRRYAFADGGYARWTREGYVCLDSKRYATRGERRVQPATDSASITALAAWLANCDAPLRGRSVGREAVSS